MKAFLFLTLVVSFFVGCSDTADKKLVPDEATKIAKAIFDAFNAHDWKAMAALYSDSAQFLDPSIGKEFVQMNNKQVEAKYAELGKIFPDVFDDIQQMHVAGNVVTVEFISTGTSADGFKLKLPICTVLTIENGKVIKDASYFDQ